MTEARRAMQSGQIRVAMRVFGWLSMVVWLMIAAFAASTLVQSQTARAATVAGEPGVTNGGEFHLAQRRAQPQTTLRAVSSTVRCPSCDTTLDQSNSPAAERMRAWIREAIAAGWTRQEIRRGLVQQYGGDESILAEPDRSNAAGALAWLVPAIVAALALVVGVVSMRRWRKRGETMPAREGIMRANHDRGSDQL